MKLSIEELRSAVASYVDATKQGASWSASRDNVAGLLDKIAKIITIENPYLDKLDILDGEDLPLGKTIEEYFIDLILPSNYDSTGAGAMSPYDPTARPVVYDFTLGRKVFKLTYRYDNVERACGTEAEFANLVEIITKRLYDSFSVFKYQMKKQLLANAISKCESAHNGSSYASSTAYSTVGTYLKTTGPKYGVVVKAVTATQNTSWANCVAGGYIVELDLVSSLTAVTDTATGEAFIKSVKAKVEEASFPSEGNSLNGNTLGVAPELLLIVKKGIMPIINVDVEAGAFHMDKVALPARVISVDDFGNNATKAFAMLVDPRGIRLHNGYRAVREQVNGDGDWITYFLHTENTGFISPNTFIHVWKEA